MAMLPSDKTAVNRNAMSAIYGREKQLAELQEAFRWATLGSIELVLLSGPPGVGKSALVLEAFRPTVSERCYFTWGKFDGYSRSKPYGIWIQCFQFLIRKLLTEPEEILNKWKARFAEMVGSNVSVIAEAIPELRLLFDELPPIEPLPARENQNRFEWVFRRFVQTFTSSRHPLVLFLDDIQWADRASLQLLNALIEDPEIRHVCIICAYRNGEWTEDTDIRDQWLSDETGGYSLRRIQLDHLGLDDVQRWVSDVLGIPAEECFPFAHALFVKSVGNPFYLKHLLQSALDEGIVRHDEAKATWRWDEGKLNQLPGIEGQIDYLTGKINNLPGAASLLLAHASTLGNKFSSQLVSVIGNMDEREVVSHLEYAVQTGLLAIRAVNPGHNLYEFTHDRILQAAYSLLDEGERKRIHLKIGTYLLNEREAGKAGDDPFEIANHLNEAGELADEHLTETCVFLNEEAGRLAMKSSDYPTALRHFRHALSRMPDRYWRDVQPFAFGTLLACCECEYLCANYEQAESLLDRALAYADGWNQRAQVVKLKIDQYSNMGQYAKAIEWGLATLREAGIHVPPEPSRWSVKMEVMRTKRLFERYMETFRKPPATEEPKALRMVELFASLVGPTFFRNRDVFALLSAKIVRYLFRHGAPAAASAVYVGFGMALTTMFGDFATGYRIGKLAVELAERSGNAVLLAKTNVMFHAVISQWMNMDDKAAGQLWDASRTCMESGDYVFGSYALGGLINLSYGSLALDEFDRVLRQSLQISELTNEELVYTNIMIYRQWCDRLRTPDSRYFDINVADGDEEQSLDVVRRQESGAVTLYQIYTYKTQVHYLFGNVEESIRCAGLAEPFEKSAVQSPHKFILHLYDALALASAARKRELNPAERRRLRARMREFARFSRMSPERFGHQLRLIQAEVRNRRGEESNVMKLYDEAIDMARKQRDWHVWAVACECAAAFHERHGRRRIADVYLQEAYEAYEKWGMEAKCDDLRQRFGERLASQADVEMAASAEGTVAGEQRSADASDEEQWLLMLKESLSLPSDLNFGQTKTLLFNRIMQLSQATYGCLLAWRDDGLRVERQWPEPESSGRRHAGRTSKSDAAPRSIVQYVFRVGKPFQAENVLKDELFRYDPYFAGFTGSGAICCLPVRLQDEPAGVLYLELPPSSHPLQEQRLDALTVLAAQMMFYARLSETLSEQLPDTATEDAADREDADAAYDAGPTMPLTDREYEVLQLISKGMTNKEIAIQLGVTPGTVKVHTHNIFNKLNVNRRTQAIAQARKLKLLDP